MSKPKFRVAICGGGIGGLTLASVLGKFSNDIQIDIYESASEFSEIGAGITAWRRTWRIMEIIGLNEGLRHLAILPPTDEKKVGFVFRKGDRPEESHNFYEMMVSYGPIMVHRADFLKILTNAIGDASNVNTHFKKRMIAYQEINMSESGPSGIVMEFSDGTKAEADVLIGCDGIKSATRRCMYEHAAQTQSATNGKASDNEKEDLQRFTEPGWTGTVAYRSLVETKLLTDKHPDHRAAKTPTIYLGKNKHIVSYPVSKGRLINLIGFVTILGGEGKIYEGPTVKPVTKEEMVNHFKGWEPEAESLMESAQNPSLWTISAVRGLPFYNRGRVALLGDSCHAMTTHLGAGAGQAIEDAHILGRILSDDQVTLTNIEDALTIYDAIRRPFGNGVVEKSRMTGFMYEFNVQGYEESNNLSEDDLKDLGKLIDEQWCWQWETLPDKEWEETERRLAELQSIQRIYKS